MKAIFTFANEQDKELWTMITDVPRLMGVLPYVAAVLNVVLAGSGTILAGCMGETWNKTQIFVGIVQMLTSAFLIGWFLSIYWAYLIVMKAMKDKQEASEFLSRTNARSD